MLASYLLTPLLLSYMAARGLRDRSYLKRWRERFGLYRQEVSAGGIVIHAASVGEVNAAASLIRGLIIRYPGLPITLTSFTPTGSEQIRALFKDAVNHVYVPLDLPGAVKRFFRHFQPRLLIIMETEIWPNLYFAATQNGVPVMMANARISEASLIRFRRVGRLIRPALAQVARIAAQSETDAGRLRELGAEGERIEVTGNLKFDANLSQELHQQAISLRRSWGEQRPVFLAGSTHEGEEAPVLTAFLGLLSSFPQALLVWAPRHPQRFQHTAQLARSAGLQVQLHSEGPVWKTGMQCLVVDAMGVLLLYYAASDVAFVGGSLDRMGGHNVLEPAALSVPVLVGPHTFNFADITRQLLAKGGAHLVHDAIELEREVASVLGDPALGRQMGAAGLALVQDGQGALSRTLLMIEEILDHFKN